MLVTIKGEATKVDVRKMRQTKRKQTMIVSTRPDNGTSTRFLFLVFYDWSVSFRRLNCLHFSSLSLAWKSALFPLDKKTESKAQGDNNIYGDIFLKATKAIVVVFDPAGCFHSILSQWDKKTSAEAILPLSMVHSFFPNFRVKLLIYFGRRIEKERDNSTKKLARYAVLVKRHAE